MPTCFPAYVGLQLGYFSLKYPALTILVQSSGFRFRSNATSLLIPTCFTRDSISFLCNHMSTHISLVSLPHWTSCVYLSTVLNFWIPRVFLYAASIEYVYWIEFRYEKYGQLFVTGCILLPWFGQTEVSRCLSHVLALKIQTTLY